MWRKFSVKVLASNNSSLPRSTCKSNLKTVQKKTIQIVLKYVSYTTRDTAVTVKHEGILNFKVENEWGNKNY